MIGSSGTGSASGAGVGTDAADTEDVGVDGSGGSCECLFFPFESSSPLRGELLSLGLEESR